MKYLLIIILLTQACKISDSNNVHNPQQNQPSLIQPYNFPQNKNWCWLVSTLHCLYRIDIIRNTVNNYSKNEYYLTSLMSHLRNIFKSMIKNNLIRETSDFYSFITSSNYRSLIKEFPYT